MARLDSHSQHFLRSPRLVYELIGHSKLTRHDVVYDLGAGSGVITTALAKRVKQVVAIENEPRTLEKLQKNLKDTPNVSIVAENILSTKFPNTPYHIFANIPFRLSSQIIHLISNQSNPPINTYLVTQKQFAQKLCVDRPGFTSQLGILLAPWFSVRIRKPLRRTDFTPPPNVDTVLLEIVARPQPLLDRSKRNRFDQFTAKAFADRSFFSKHVQPFLTSEFPRPATTPINIWLQAFSTYTTKRK